MDFTITIIPLSLSLPATRFAGTPGGRGPDFVGLVLQTQPKKSAWLSNWKSKESDFTSSVLQTVFIRCAFPSENIEKLNRYELRVPSPRFVGEGQGEGEHYFFQA